MSYAIADALTKLMSAGYVVNKTTAYAVWIEYSGHVDSISVRVAVGKEKGEFEEKISDERIYLSGSWIDSEEETIVKINEQIEYLNTLLSGSCISVESEQVTK